MKVAFVGDQSITLEIVELIRGQESDQELQGANHKGDMFHIALTVASLEHTAGEIERAGGCRLGEVVQLPGGISFVHCLDPWANAIELMDGHFAGMD